MLREHAHLAARRGAALERQTGGPHGPGVRGGASHPRVLRPAQGRLVPLGRGEALGHLGGGRRAVHDDGTEALQAPAVPAVEELEVGHGPMVAWAACRRISPLPLPS